MLKISAFITLVIFNSLVLHKVLISHKIIKNTNYLTMAIFILLSLPIMHLESSWIIISTNFLLVLILNELLNLAQSNNPQKQVFNAGFYVGIIWVIQFYLGIYYFLISFFLGYEKKYSPRNFITQNVGVLVPIVIFYSILFFIQPDFNFLNKNESLLNNSLSQYTASYALLIFIIILAVIEIVYNFHKKKIKSKQTFLIIVVITALSVFSALVWNFKQFAYLTITPITIIVTNYLIYTKYIGFRTFLLGLWIVLFLFEFFYI